MAPVELLCSKVECIHQLGVYMQDILDPHRVSCQVYYNNHTSLSIFTTKVSHIVVQFIKLCNANTGR